MRSRAGAPTKSSITYADIFLEKKVEFALEEVIRGTIGNNGIILMLLKHYNISVHRTGELIIFHITMAILLLLFGTDNRTPGTVNFAITPITVDIPYPEAEKLVSPILHYRQFLLILAN